MTQSKFWRSVKKNRNAYILLAPAFIFIILFSYVPLLDGLRISLSDYHFYKGSTFVGLKHYMKVLGDSFFWKSVGNTVILGVGGLAIGTLCQVILALLINEVSSKWYKKAVQTIVYLPNLFSWVAVAGIWISLLAPDRGIVNNVIQSLGYEPIHFMANESIIRGLYIFLNTWKSVGYGCIIILAALTSIDPCLFEAAYIDGADRFKQIIHVTLPSIAGTVKVVLLLGVIGMLRIFTPVQVLINPAVENKLMVAMLYTYRMGIENLNFDYATAAAYIVLVMTATLTLMYKLLTRKKEVE